MPPSLILVNRIVWTTSALFCIAILFVGLGNRRVKTLPLFFVLVGWYPIDFLLFFAVQGTRSFSIWTWCTSFLMVSLFILEIAVLYELSNTLIFSRKAMGRHFRSLPRWALAVLILVSTVLAALTRDGSSDAGLSAFARLTYAEDLIEIGLLLAVVVLTGILGISWRNLPAGIALGWGISSLFDLGAKFLSPGDGYGFLRQDIVRGLGFNACSLVWLWFTLRPEAKEIRHSPSVDVGGLQEQIREELDHISGMHRL